MEIMENFFLVKFIEILLLYNICILAHMLLISSVIYCFKNILHEEKVVGVRLNKNANIYLSLRLQLEIVFIFSLRNYCI